MDAGQRTKKTRKSRTFSYYTLHFGQEHPLDLIRPYVKIRVDYSNMHF